jgi:hypothetical protein
MGAKYLFRLDDISWDMDLEKFNKVETIFKKYNVRPLIGVIPNNKDKSLKSFSKDLIINQNDFWNKILILQNQFDWAIALHGYDHVYTTKNSGILGINKRSEFAGLSEEIQHKKISMGKDILEKNGLSISAFMAPAHSFDQITLKVLRRNGINVITDGQTMYPYYKGGICFVPQLLPNLLKMPIGVFTICIHTNTMSENDIKELDRFIEKNNGDIIEFKDAVNIAGNKGTHKVINFISFIPIKLLLKMIKKYYSIMSNFRKRKNHE